jgi:hypothetical protein
VMSTSIEKVLSNGYPVWSKCSHIQFETLVKNSLSPSPSPSPSSSSHRSPYHHQKLMCLIAKPDPSTTWKPGSCGNGYVIRVIVVIDRIFFFFK